MSFANTLREKRIKKGFSQQELAQKAGVSQSAIGYWERGEKTPSLDAARKVAKILDIDLNQND